MKREEFCEVLGDINENYVKEAGANPKAEIFIYISLSMSYVPLIRGV